MAENEKEPTPTPEGDSSLKDNLNQQDNITAEEKAQDALKGRHFAYVVYPESAPEDWREQLVQTGLAFVVSPLHDKDENPDGTPKKPHWHLIVSWGNSTTYRSARALCDTVLNCPRPQILKNPNGMYRYLTHKDNPEKYQYTEQPKTYNGWTKPLTNEDVSALMNEIRRMMYLEDCREYGELCSVCAMKGAEYLEVVQNKTLFFGKLCDSLRNSYGRTMMRFYNELAELGTPEEQEKILAYIREYEYQKQKQEEMQ